MVRGVRSNMIDNASRRMSASRPKLYVWAVLALSAFLRYYDLAYGKCDMWSLNECARRRALDWVSSIRSLAVRGQSDTVEGVRFIACPSCTSTIWSCVSKINADRWPCYRLRLPSIRLKTSPAGRFLPGAVSARCLPSSHAPSASLLRDFEGTVSARSLCPAAPTEGAVLAAALAARR